MQRPISERVEHILGILEAAAEADYIGEDVSQLEHALQCAALACQEGAGDELVLAALLHDIGHLCDREAPQMDGWGTASHERVGAQFLSDQGFSSTIQKLVLGHVEAKRYLVGKHQAYAAKLSEASRQTLLRQGGAMSEEECLSFEQDPLFQHKLQMRAWDDAGKVTDLTVHPLSFYRPLLYRHLEAPTTSS